MRCLKLVILRHVDGNVSTSIRIPSGTRRTKRRTRKKWFRRAIEHSWLEAKRRRDHV